MFQSFSKLLRGGSRAASFSLISVNCRLLMKESLPPFSKVNPVSSVKGLVYLGYWKQSGFYPMFWMPNVNFLLKLSNSLKTVFLYILKLLKTDIYRANCSGSYSEIEPLNQDCIFNTACAMRVYFSHPPKAYSSSH